MITSLRRRLRHVQNSFPAGGVLVALLLGYFAYRKYGPGSAAPAALVTWTDLDNVAHGGADFAQHRATVLFFTSLQCPCSDVFSAPMARIAQEFAPQGARFFAVFSNGDDSPEAIRQFMEARKFGFPAVKDEGGRLAARLRSVVTPSAVVIDARGRAAFVGAVGRVPEKEGEPVDCGQLAAMLTAVIADSPLPRVQALPAGCAIVGPAVAGLPSIAPNDNRALAGRLEAGVFTLRLVAEKGVWRPEKQDGAAFPMHAFREEGKPLQSPGPLIRVPVGTELRVTVRNTLAGEPLEVHGLHERDGKTDTPPVLLATGEEREFRWRAGEPGTFLYWASVGPPPLGFPTNESALLNGGLIVDPVDAPPDPRERVFMINQYFEFAPNTAQNADTDATGVVVLRMVPTLNGLTWPYTEPLRYQLGDTVLWRVINAGAAAHPMHLHGFHFDVLSRFDGEREVRYAEAAREKAVTELLLSRGSVAIAWQPTEVGRWLFHCHMAAHFASRLRVRPPGKGPEVDDEHKRHAMEDMSGLVLGIEVQPGANPPPPKPSGPAREITLHVQQHRATPRALTYEPQEGADAEPPLSEIMIPARPLVLTRGERARIKVVNHLSEPTAVHWHGIELESYYDGVVGWGGHATSVTPSIEPGKTFVAEMSPPRAGTYIYHAHFDDERQLRAGLYGAMIVVEPGQRFDPEKERIVVLSSGRAAGTGLRINGSVTPESMRLKAGQTYRLRLINITLNTSRVALRLEGGRGLARWRAVAKDGADLPPASVQVQPAEQTVTVGETRDFEFTPEEPGAMRLVAVNATGNPLVALPVFVE